jgi:hypothetical protein
MLGSSFRNLDFNRQGAPKMKSNKWVSLGASIVTTMLMVGGLAGQVMIAAEAFTGPVTHGVRKVPLLTLDKITVVVHRNNALSQAPAAEDHG